MIRLLDKIRDSDFLKSNSIIQQICGIVDYFSSEEEKADFINSALRAVNTVQDSRASYGDWQTPAGLANAVCKRHLQYFGSPKIVIEPTCGLGAFVVAALDLFPDVREIHAVEINKDYTSNLKLRILLRALDRPGAHNPTIHIHTADFFKFDLSPVFNRAEAERLPIAIIGNPPWVTNSRQGADNSDNIPVKSNRYHLRGIEALTGKSNFDISESITLQLINLADRCDGGISFLLKNSVIRNILTKQKTHPLNIGNIKQLTIDAGREFNVAVDSSYLAARLNTTPSVTCQTRDFYLDSPGREYGWVGDSFVADIHLYSQARAFDGQSSYQWRSGIKHDCAPILELSRDNGHYHNGLGQSVNVEECMIFPLLKSSDIGHEFDGNLRRYIILPQHYVGEDTRRLIHDAPLTYDYLSEHRSFFEKRKSSIYKGKSPFSIFGIGDYSFKPYKIVVSSFYKEIRFSLIKPIGTKPVMVDDTCYQIGFDNLDECLAVLDVLRSPELQSLLKSIVFTDAKRVVTKGLLMRLDIAKVIERQHGHH
ncbi:MAG: hypothetical protein NC117_03435 [Pseudoflavonifractor sp.]|nr:hypothetical protein [Pseudoflavonifractor sp.]